MNDIEISIKSLLFYMLSKWKSLIVGMILGAIIAGFVGAYRTGTNATTDTTTDTITNVTVSTSLNYLVVTDSPDELINVQQALVVMLRSNEYYGYLSTVTGMPIADVKKYVTIDCSGINDATTMAAIVVNITDASVEDAERFLASTTTYVEDRSDELSQKGFSHKLIRTDSFEYDKETLIEEPQEKQYENPEPVAAPVFSRKYALIGFALGLFAVACWHFLIYVFANKLDEEDDFENAYGLFFFGIIPGKEYGSLLFKLKNLGRRTFDPEESCNLIAAKIKMTAEKNGIKSLGIVGCNIVKNSKDISEKLISKLKESGIDAVLIDNALYDETSIKELNKLENIVIFEKSGKTIRTEVWKEIEVAKKLGIKICGMIIAGN